MPLDSKQLVLNEKKEKFLNDDKSEDYDPWKAPELVDNSPAWSGKRAFLEGYLFYDKISVMCYCTGRYRVHQP